MNLDYAEEVEQVQLTKEECGICTVNYGVSGDDMILQVFPPLDPVEQGKAVKVAVELDSLGGRVAKALLDSVGEAGMERMVIEEIYDQMIGQSIFVRAKDFSNEISRNLFIPRVLKELDITLRP